MTSVKVMPHLDEVWKAVPGFPNYEISSYGRLRSWVNRTKRLPKPELKEAHLDPTGRRLVYLFCGPNGKKTLSIARLVLTVFVRPPEPGEVARHYHNKDVTNCHVDNLRWGTPADNWDDSARHNGGEYPSKGRVLSAETRAKMSASRTGRIVSAETRAKIAAKARGRKASATTRAKLSAAKIGNQNARKG